MAEEKMDFGADVSRLLNIVANALYSNRDVFLRELISNAADACDRLRYQTINEPKLIKDDPDFKIHVFKDAPARKLTVIDNGIGMTRDELVENLGTIAKSGTAALMEQMKDADSQSDKMSLIGQFGVGFYACFMISENVKVISRKAGDKQAWMWESDGRTGFTIREATKDEAKILEPANRGTAIIVSIDDNSSEFLIDQKLEEVIKTWSDHITVPIYLGAPAKGDDKPEQVNNASALWMKSKNEISEDEYKAFYRHITHGMDDPIMTSHWRAEGKIEYSALLFVPTMRPWDLYDPTRKASTRLYVKRVMITEDCEGLMYPWLRFVRGVVDSEDLPLNISREMLQHNPIIEKIKRGVAKRILGDLNKLAQDDPGEYAIFWGQFGATLKEGLYDAFEHKDDLLKVVRFYSTHGDGMELTSLEDYVSRMKDDQSEIYYISGENLDTLKNSPQIEGFKARGIEVLFFTDTIDDFWLQNQSDYKGKPFKSVTKGNIDLDRFESEKGEEKEKDTKISVDANLEKLVAAIKDNLADEVGEVRLTNRLTDSPVCLIAADNEVDLRMERVLRIHQKYEAPTKRILEVNGKHPLIKQMAAKIKAGSNERELADAAHLLMDQARIIQGEPVPDPAGFARRMSAFMARGLGGTPSPEAPTSQEDKAA